MMSMHIKNVKIAAALTVLMSVVGLSGCQPSSEKSISANVSASSSSPSASLASLNGETVSVKADLSSNMRQDVFTVYRDPNCGCCHEWVKHAKASQLTIVDKVLADNAAVSQIKDQQHVPTEMRSCHTVVSQSGYVFEGHVPAKYIDQFLQNPPKDAIGLAVAGMPVGSPGMEVGDNFNPYPVMLLHKDGHTTQYAMVNTPEQQI